MEDVKISIKDFATRVNMLNDGHDRDTVFYYLKDYLRVLNIKNVDIKKLVRDYDDSDE